jgi:hypothetical protein
MFRGERMRKLLVRVATICLPALLSGCLAMGDIDRRATTFDEGVGSFQNRAVLLNLARASQKEPMYFVSVGATQAQGSTDFRASAPSFGEGPSLASSVHAYTFSPGGSTFLDNTTSTNTQMNVFSTHDFYLGMMEPLTLDEINLLLHQGYQRELVFYLTIAKARITPLDSKTFEANGAPHYIYNDPDGDPANYAEFAGHIRLAMDAGLTTDVAVEPKPDASAAPDKEIAYAPAPPSAPGKGGVEFVLKAETKPAPKVVECLDKALQSKNGRNFLGQVKSLKEVRFCGEPENGVRKNVVYWPNAKTGQLEPQEIEIVFRSTYEIFRYLGALMNDQGTSAEHCADPQGQNAAPLICDYQATETDPTEIGPLFRVEAGGAGSCFTAVSYSNRRYCVPNGGREADMTKDVFNILVSLLALKQSPGDLPTPQAVVLQ